MRDTQSSLSTQAVEAVSWIVDTGFPFDWTTEDRPPEWMLTEMARQWCERDGNGSLTPADYRYSIELETGWADA